MVDVGRYGSKNDSGVLINSEMNQKFEESSFDFWFTRGKKFGTMSCRITRLSLSWWWDPPFETAANTPLTGQLSKEEMIFN